MDFIKKYKFELITFIAFASLSILYYIDTGEVRVIGWLVLSLYLLSALIRICQWVFTKNHTKPISKRS